MSVITPADEGFLLSSEMTSTSRTVDPDKFLEMRASLAFYKTDPVPLESLPEWRFGSNFRHSSDRFFSVDGLAIQTNFGTISSWNQPIIVQSEIGILGIIVKKIDGVFHFLMQAKMEPGNSALVQYAATVQATPSNYQRVHGGKPTPYLEYFLDRSRRRIIVDHLLSEHACWYLYKRNRNMIVEISPHEDVALDDDFAWLTLGQLRRLIAQGNRVNMNARSVLSCISYASAAMPGSVGSGSDFRTEIFESHRFLRSDADLLDGMTWLIDQKSRFDLTLRRIPLQDMDEWLIEPECIRHVDGRYFKIIGLSVRATSREVGAWSQPMLEPVPGGTVAFICQRRAGVLQFLVQALVQPGFTDRIELGATIQLSPGNYRDIRDVPPLAGYLDSPASWILVDATQSEDGGRFRNADTRHVVIRVPEDHKVDIPENYSWMSLGLLNRLTISGYYVNVEARSLMSCIL